MRIKHCDRLYGTLITNYCFHGSYHAITRNSRLINMAKYYSDSKIEMLKKLNLC